MERLTIVFCRFVFHLVCGQCGFVQFCVPSCHWLWSLLFYFPPREARRVCHPTQHILGFSAALAPKFPPLWPAWASRVSFTHVGIMHGRIEKQTSISEVLCFRFAITKGRINQLTRAPPGTTGLAGTVGLGKPCTRVHEEPESNQNQTFSLANWPGAPPGAIDTRTSGSKRRWVTGVL